MSDACYICAINNQLPILDPNTESTDSWSILDHEIQVLIDNYITFIYNEFVYYIYHNM